MAALRIGVMGCADIARRRLLPAMRTAEGIDLAAVASRDPAKAAEFAHRFDCRPVLGYAELLARDDVDAVYLPLPAALHAHWAEAALRAGKHVLAEKPLATEPEQVERLVALARSAGLVLMENVMFPHHPQHEAVRKLVATGAIGELRLLSSSFTVPRLPAGDIRLQAALGGGALWDTGVYPVRAALHLLGDGLEVIGAALPRRGPGGEVDTSGTALLSAPGGIGVQLAFGLDHGYRSMYELCGSEGRITVERAFTPPPDWAPLVRLERQGKVEEIRLPPADQVAAALAAFVGAVRAGADPGSGAGSIAQCRLLHAIRRAATPVAVPAPGAPCPLLAGEVAVGAEPDAPQIFRGID